MEKFQWKEPQKGFFILFSSDLPKEKQKIAGFDLDWTLYRPHKSQFPKNERDFIFLPGRKERLKELSKEYFIVIFSNQKRNINLQLQRITLVVSELLPLINYKLIVMVAEIDAYRKPATLMWNYLESLITIDKTNFFYSGDAAGRIGEFSSSDLQFAKNIDIKFYFLEEIFPPKKYDWKALSQKTLLIFVGSPGSGKSTFVKTNLLPLNWIWLNQDQLKTFQKMIKTAENNMKEGNKIIIDATNSTREKRKQYIDLAKKYGYTTYILYFVAYGGERNKLRPENERVPEIAIRTYYSRLEPPSFEEDGIPVEEIY